MIADGAAMVDEQAGVVHDVIISGERSACLNVVDRLQKHDFEQLNVESQVGVEGKGRQVEVREIVEESPLHGKQITYRR